ncbi:MAG: hypothetical protein GDA35_09845 [Hyphomonadaceae bacterium]|nr:hypothetical protein [Hyphomonadaceae bacterium]
MQMHSKKRLELMIEKPAIKRACRILEGAGVKGYTVVPAVGGYRDGQSWTRGVDISSANDTLVIISIMDEGIVEKCIRDLEELISIHTGFLSLSDVTVIRDDMF